MTSKGILALCLATFIAAAVPATGMAEGSEAQQSIEAVEQQSENKPGGLVDGAKSMWAKTKANLASAKDKYFDPSTREKELEEKIAYLKTVIDGLEDQLVSKSVNAQLDHRSALTCHKKVKVYLESLEVVGDEQ